MREVKEVLAKGLIVSCQALEHEPLHSSFIMGRMARAAVEGGAIGIRANSKADIIEIKNTVDVPVIGIVKRDYENCPVYITPTMDEVDELVEAGVDIIALDATQSIRPNGETVAEFVQLIRQRYEHVKLFADVSTLEEALMADEIGFDFIAPTLVGYTEQSKHLKIAENDFQLLKEMLQRVQTPIIAEGNISSPEKACRVLELGVHAVVVGSSITRPQLITKSYVEAMKEAVR